VSTPPSSPNADDVQPFEKLEKHADSLPACADANTDSEEAPSSEQDFALSLRHRALSPPVELPVTVVISRPSGSEMISQRNITVPRFECTFSIPSLQSSAPDTSSISFSKLMYEFVWAAFFSKDVFTPVRSSLQQQLHLTPQNPIKDLTSRMDPLLRHVISNQTNPDRIFNTLIRRTKDENDLLFLRGLLVSKALDVNLKHFAEKLLVDATIDGNLPLMEILVDAGVDVNARSIQEGAMDSGDRKVTALHMAVYNRREDLIKYLLCHGAHDWHAHYMGFAGGDIHGSVLDLVMEMGNLHEWTMNRPEQNVLISRSILEVLLTFRSRTRNQPLGMLLRASRLAILNDRIDMIHILFRHYPILLKEAQLKPWLLLEPAATIRGTALFEELLSMGLDMHAIDSRGYGSVMAAAASLPNMQLMTYFLAEHVDINGVAYGLGPSYDNENGTLSNDRLTLLSSEFNLEGLHGMAALHLAVSQQNEQLTRLLLFYAANSNQCCRLYPLQLATWKGHEGIVRLRQLR
jgi:ankyrin repeat protein